jgi:uncharacterized protein YfcZ (UPF0381/DUF406 family)
MTCTTTNLVNTVCGSIAQVFYDKDNDNNYNFYVENTEHAEYFFDKYFTLSKNVNVNCMNLESPWIKNVWKLDIDWLALIIETTQEQMQIVGDLVCLPLPPASENLSDSLQTWVAIDTNKNKVVSLQQWGYWIKDDECLDKWLIHLGKIS